MSSILKTELAKFDHLAVTILDKLPCLDDYIINGVWDDAGLEAAKAAHRRVRALVNDIERQRKEIKEPILAAGKAVDERAKELVNLTENVDHELKRRIADIEMQREAIKQEKRHNRTAELTQAGYEFTAGAYRIGDQVIVASAIDDATDDEWIGIIERGKAAAERVKLERAAHEAELERIKLEREQLEMERRELDKLRKSMASQHTEDAEPESIDEIEDATDNISNNISADYVSGFNACRTLAMQIVIKCSKRSEIIAMLDELNAE